MSGSPSEVVHLDEPWLSIVWDEAHQCVYAKFKAFASSVDFRKGTTKILLVVKERNATRLISDNRLLEGVSAVDQLWLRDSWIPMAVGAGLERHASCPLEVLGVVLGVRDFSSMNVHLPLVRSPACGIVGRQDSMNTIRGQEAIRDSLLEAVRVERIAEVGIGVAVILS